MILYLKIEWFYFILIDWLYDNKKYIEHIIDSLIVGIISCPFCQYLIVGYLLLTFAI